MSLAGFFVDDGSDRLTWVPEPPKDPEQTGRRSARVPSVLFERRAVFCKGEQGATQPDVLRRLDFREFYDACVAVDADKGHRVEIAGSRTEFYLDGRKGGPFLQRVLDTANPREPGRTFQSAWTAFRQLVENKTTAALARLGVTEAVEFSGYSLIVQEDAAAQPPHTDMLNGGQCVVVLQDGAPSTLVYNGRYASLAQAEQRVTSTERAIRNKEYKKAFQGLGRDDFLGAVATAAVIPRAEVRMRSTTLNTGEFSLLTGPVIHAAPAYEGFRMVLFFTFNVVGGQKYDTDTQFGPVSAAQALNSAELVVERFREYDPEFNFARFTSQLTTPPKKHANGERTVFELFTEWHAGGPPADAVAQLRRNFTELKM